jgi:hypothetical protein
VVSLQVVAVVLVAPQMLVEQVAQVVAVMAHLQLTALRVP